MLRCNQYLPDIVEVMLVDSEHGSLSPELDQGVSLLCEQPQQLPAGVPHNTSQAPLITANTNRISLQKEKYCRCTEYGFCRISG